MMIEKILGFMKQAGQIAKDNQYNINLADEHQLKEDAIHSIVTKTDFQVSELFSNFIKQNFSDINYLIIDEETISEVSNNPFEIIKKTEYTFVIDPIDGTLPYSLKIPEYGISVGILKYGKPYLGVIYAPGINELVYCDEKNVYWLENAFSGQERKSQLVERSITPKAFLLECPWFFTMNNKQNINKNISVNFYSAVLQLLYVATGRARCYYFGGRLWDMCGSWAILKQLGFDFFNYDDGTAIEEVNEKTFASNFRTRTGHIVCKKEDFEFLKSITDLNIR